MRNEAEIKNLINICKAANEELKTHAKIHRLNYKKNYDIYLLGKAVEYESTIKENNDTIICLEWVLEEKAKTNER